MTTLRLVFGDQLSHEVSSLADLQSGDVVLLMEVVEEAVHVPHHPKKLVFVFSAMRHFAAELSERGANVDYIKLDDARSQGSFTATLAAYLETQTFSRLVLTKPSEHRVQALIDTWSVAFGLAVEQREDNRFLVTPDEFADWADGRKQLVMETFYRRIRERTGLLMEDGKPAGGRWNYDKENRRPADATATFPSPLEFPPDEITCDVMELVRDRFDDHFGQVDPFWFAVTTEHATAAADAFFAECLPRFGEFQDAMLADQNFLYHSVLSHYMNIGLLDPLDLCERAAACYEAGAAPINAVEGFIRQIIGWREFVRGIYWLKMPAYAALNFLGAQRSLPAAFWGGETKMACIRAAVAQTESEAYAHHIQRLMVTGNFALLIGVAPEEIHQWYLAVYADAYEWVEMPNTLGMAVFADGGILGTKPYAASGAYINKMSDYCGGCQYNVKQKSGTDACPFNYLYWDFLARNTAKLADNHRMRLPYMQYKKMSATRKREIGDDAGRFLSLLDAGEPV